LFDRQGLRQQALAPLALPASHRSVPRPPAVGSFQH
jgi:sn-glycerol 3-phosphate transport system ATP-binding protein